jgi:hypothetical protein
MFNGMLYDTLFEKTNEMFLMKFKKKKSKDEAEEEKKKLAGKPMLEGVVDRILVALRVVVFTLMSILLGCVPYIGPVLNMVCYSWLYSLACWEPRWTQQFESRSPDMNLKYIERGYFYFSGFGASLVCPAAPHPPTVMLMRAPLGPVSALRIHIRSPDVLVPDLDQLWHLRYPLPSGTQRDATWRPVLGFVFKTDSLTPLPTLRVQFVVVACGSTPRFPKELRVFPTQIGIFKEAEQLSDFAFGGLPRMLANGWLRRLFVFSSSSSRPVRRDSLTLTLFSSSHACQHAMVTHANRSSKAKVVKINSSLLFVHLYIVLINDSKNKIYIL